MPRSTTLPGGERVVPVFTPVEGAEPVQWPPPPTQPVVPVDITEYRRTRQGEQAAACDDAAVPEIHVELEGIQ